MNFSDSDRGLTGPQKPQIWGVKASAKKWAKINILRITQHSYQMIGFYEQIQVRKKKLLKSTIIGGMGPQKERFDPQFGQ